MKRKRICCPQCGKSDAIYVNCAGEEVGKILGGGAGVAFSSSAATGGMVTGAAIGSSIPIVGTIAGAGLGGLTGVIIGLYSGMSAGRELGRCYDEVWSGLMKCAHCQCEFKK